VAARRQNGRPSLFVRQSPQRTTGILISSFKESIVLTKVLNNQFKCAVKRMNCCSLYEWAAASGTLTASQSVLSVVVVVVVSRHLRNIGLAVNFSPLFLSRLQFT
jgi:hypothetical protein